MFVPVHDVNPLKRMPFQWGTVGIIALNILCYLVFATEFFSPADAYVIDFALIPVEFTSGGENVSSWIFRLKEPLPVPEWVTLISYMFLHLSFVHLAGNMVFLWVFGDNVEDALGIVRYILFFLLCGVAAALAHVALMPESDIPVVGASGGVGGVIGAYLMLHPKVKIWILALYRIPLRISAGLAIAVWLAVQLYHAFAGKEDTIAWGAHLAGFFTGVLLILVMRPPGVELFDRSLGKT